MIREGTDVCQQVIHFTSRPTQDNHFVLEPPWKNSLPADFRKPSHPRHLSNTQINVVCDTYGRICVL